MGANACKFETGDVRFLGIYDIRDPVRSKKFATKFRAGGCGQGHKSSSELNLTVEVLLFISNVMIISCNQAMVSSWWCVQMQKELGWSGLLEEACFLSAFARR